MSFKKKQFLGFGMILLFIVILLGAIIIMMNSVRNDLLEIVGDRYGKVKAATEIRQNFSASDRELLYLLNGLNTADMKTSIQTIESGRAKIQADIRMLSGILNRQKSQELLAELQTQYGIYVEIERKIIQNIQAGMPVDDFRPLLEDQREKRSTLVNQISQFKEYQESLMDEALQRANGTYEMMLNFTVIAVAICLVISMGVALWVIRSTSLQLHKITQVMGQVDFTNTTSLPRIEAKTKDEIGQIALAFNEMASSLEEHNRKEQRYNERIGEQNWLQTRIADIATMYQGIASVETLAGRFIDRICEMTGASLGVFYIRESEAEGARFVKLAAFASHMDGAGREKIRLGEGLIGQCARDGRVRYVEDIPNNYQPIVSGLGEVRPASIMIAPVKFEGNVVAVVELASLTAFTPLQQKLLEQLLDTLGITVNSVLGRMEVERLLKESQAMTEELQAQSEELQAQSEELQMQSEELRMINEQLEERSEEAEQKSSELERAKTELEEKAEQLLLSSKYKSEFLANMSHELRTPLNSILILSEMLSENQDGTSVEEQREFAQVIHSSGQDLLTLINDILDLSKVEAGKLDIMFSEMNMSELPVRLERNFSHIAKQKELAFTIEKSEDLPDIFYTDEQRFQQILKNLLSNAFKFTETGSVSVIMRKVEESSVAKWIRTEGADCWLEISVTDTGIGIPREKQNLIFEAFQQADGATMRKYGGTGLGLSICREFVRLLGGWVTVVSEEGQGSTFILYVPSLPNGLSRTEEVTSVAIEVAAGALETEEKELHLLPLGVPEEQGRNTSVPLLPAEDENVFRGKNVIVVDDDNRNIFALKNALENEGMHVITAWNGMECLQVMNTMETIDVVLMDIMMPDMDGYETMRCIREVDRFADLPIIALTAKAMKGDREKCLEAGASDYISKPLKLEQLMSVMRVWLTK
ncbi:ATP-binding protein [Aneurinibacillus sp. REN35]|uniref:ATP-binding protein n=1 Tax=Aneurinibacillus sp. REN35 TaxID=3237286 RepID=UPI003527A195